MSKNLSKEINEQIDYGLDSIDSEAKIEIKLKDFMLIYKTFEEFNRFFHNNRHYETIDDIETYLGNKDFGAYSIIRKLYYDTLGKYIPEDIKSKLEQDNNPFENPDSPFYFKEKNDKTINDGTIKVVDRDSFVKYVDELLTDFNENGKNWENNQIESFIDGISAYAADIDGYYKNMNFDTSSEVPTWRLFAQILKGATLYE